jgi:hypothetical protein
MSAVMFAAALLLGTPSPVAWPPVLMGHIDDGKPFDGGPYAGLAVGTATTPDGKTLRALKPSRPGVSPVSAKNAAAVSAFVAGHANPASEPLALFLARNATFVFCRRQGEVCYVSKPAPLTFAEQVEANTPYGMEGGKVRIEWVYGTAVWYFTELTLKDGKIASVQTQPGWLPLEVKKPR